MTIMIYRRGYMNLAPFWVIEDVLEVVWDDEWVKMLTVTGAVRVSLDEIASLQEIHEE